MIIRSEKPNSNTKNLYVTLPIDPSILQHLLITLRIVQYWVGHLNTILARGEVNLNEPIFKSSNARGIARGGDAEASN